MKPAQIVLFNRISTVEKLLFTKHLAIMLKSGVTLEEAIDTLKEQTQNSSFKKILQSIYDNVANGQSLYKSLTKHPKVFDSLYQNIVRIGEESGTLESNLDYLSIQLQKGYEFQKKVSGAMMYPALVVFMALAVGSGISIFVLPQFANVFKSMGVDLPITTKILIYISQMMKSYGIIIIPSIFVSIFLFGVIVNTKLLKYRWQMFLLNLPILGKFIQSVQAGSICRNLGLMLKSGLPISQSLAVLSDSTNNLVYRKIIDSARDSLDNGTQIGAEFSYKKYSYIPVVMSKMIQVGEKTGKLDETLLYLGDFFEEEVDTTAKNLPTILEPVLLVIIAGVVLFLALAIISPIYQLTGSINK
jgi:type IV pilus assembly protein PilC